MRFTPWPGRRENPEKKSCRKLLRACGLCWTSRSTEVRLRMISRCWRRSTQNGFKARYIRYFQWRTGRRRRKNTAGKSKRNSTPVNRWARAGLQNLRRAKKRTRGQAAIRTRGRTSGPGGRRTSGRDRRTSGRDRRTSGRGRWTSGRGRRTSGRGRRTSGRGSGQGGRRTNGRISGPAVRRTKGGTRGRAATPIRDGTSGRAAGSAGMIKTRTA